mgnify:CR=1 FL=1
MIQKRIKSEKKRICVVIITPCLYKGLISGLCVKHTWHETQSVGAFQIKDKNHLYSREKEQNKPGKSWYRHTLLQHNCCQRERYLNNLWDNY